MLSKVVTCVKRFQDNIFCFLSASPFFPCVLLVTFVTFIVCLLAHDLIFLQ